MKKIIKDVSRKIKTLLTKVGYSSKPEFLIIGAQKAGTTGLFSILCEHSLLKGSYKKEIHFFDDDKWYNVNKLYQYHSYFVLPHHVPKGGKVFEATPVYMYHPKVAGRLHLYNPNLKLIVILRNPVERAFSAWTMYHHHFKTGVYKELHDSRSFSDAIQEEIENINKTDYYKNKIAYVKRGIYHYQIEAYLNYFNIDQMLFIESNMLKLQFNTTLKEILSFIGVPYENLEVNTINKRQVDEENEYLKDIQKLKTFYKPYNKKLFELIGKNFKWNEKL